MKPVSRREGEYIHTIYPTAREVVIRDGVPTIITYGDPEFDSRHPWPPPGFEETPPDSQTPPTSR